jgi:WD40 repeat protein
MKNSLCYILLFFLAFQSLGQIGEGTANKQPKLVVPVGHTGIITEIHLSQKEDLLSSFGYEEGLSKLWDVKTGKQLEINIGNWEVNHYKSYKIMPNGKFISISSLNGIDVLELGSNKIVFHIEDSVFSAYSHDESQLFVGQKGSNNFKIYNTENFEFIREIKELPDFMFIHAHSFLELDAKNNLLYLEHTSYLENGTEESFVIVDLNTEKVIKIPKNGRGLEGERMFSFGINSNYLITEHSFYGDETHTIVRIYDKSTGQKIKEIVTDFLIDEMGTTENEDYLWYRNYDSDDWSALGYAVWIYDLKKQEEAEIVSLKEDQYADEDYSYHIGNKDYTTKYFSLNDWIKFDQKFKYHDQNKTNYLVCPEIASLKDQLTIFGQDIEAGHNLEIRNISTDTLISKIEIETTFRYYSAVFLNKGTQIIIAYENNIALFDVESGRKIREFQSHSEMLSVVVSDSLEENIAIGSEAGNVHIYHKAQNKFNSIHVGEKDVNDILLDDGILYCGGRDFLNAWDIHTNELVLDFSNNGDNWIGYVSDIELVTTKNKKYLKTSEDYLLDDIVTEQNMYDVTSGEKVVNSSDIISVNAENVIYRGYDSLIYFWDYGDSAVELMSKFQGQKENLYTVEKLLVSPNSNFLVTITGKKMTIWNLFTGKKSKEIKFERIESFDDFKFDDLGQSLYFCDLYEAFQIDLASAKVVNKWENAWKVSIAKDYLVLEIKDGPIQFAIYDRKTSVKLKEVEIEGHFIDFNKDRNVFVFKESSSNRIVFYDMEKGQIVSTNSNPLDMLKQESRFSKEKEVTCNFVTGSMYGINGNELMKFNYYNGELECRIIPLGVNNMITILPSGYYQASQNAAKMSHYVTEDLKVIAFDQLDLRYNRPDKVLEALGNSDALLIHSYKTAYEKRIRKMGVDTTLFNDNFSVPVLEFTNREEVKVEQYTKELKLHIRGWDSTFQLDRFNVWMNEVPIFGERGISIKNRNTNYFDTTITVELSNGSNRIETSMFNTNQLESYRMPLYVNYVRPLTQTSKELERTYFIGIGIDRFQEPGHHLSYSVKDILDLSKALKEKLGDQLIIDTVFNENVNVANIEKLKERLKNTGINDKVIIVYSGHGLLNKNFDYYLSAYNVDFNNPEIGGIPYDVLSDVLDNIPARKKLLLIDACHSGEVDKDELIVSNESANEGEKDGNNKVKMKLGKVGLTNSFQLMQELFVDVEKGSGATVISAAGGDQSALEGGGLQNGYFTYAILQLLNSKKTATVNELKEYVLKEVLVLSKGKQKPTSRVENLEVDWQVW